MAKKPLLKKAKKLEATKPLITLAALVSKSCALLR